MKDIILFDLDGTITDPKVGITRSVQYSLEYFGIHVQNPDELCKFIGPPLWKSFIEFYGFDQEKANKAVEKYREYFLERGIYENILYDGMDMMLSTLKQQGRTLILATSKPIIQAEKVLDYFNLDNYIDFVSGAELNGDRSDKAEVILYALEKFRMNKLSHCIMVGDRKHDIIGATRVGIDSVGVLYGYGGFEELSAAQPKYLVKSVVELSDLLYCC